LLVSSDQMAILKFMNAVRRKTSFPTTVHCDHLIQAYKGAETDLATAKSVNAEVYQFLQSAAQHYGMGFWGAGAGIIHQVVLENYAFPGGMMVGTDSHTPNAGGLGMAAIGVGGADAVDVMVGAPWELKVPRLIGVHLTGKLSGWTSAKDIILYLAGRLTTKGGTNAIIEYFGDGAEHLSATGKATVCNMGAEVGATTSMFPYDSQMEAYLKATGRTHVAEMANSIAADLKADPEVAAHPEKYFDEYITIDLSQLHPYLNGPFTPDAACPVSEMQAKVTENGYPDKVEVCLIGSCTNSSYQDLARAASVIQAMTQAGKKLKAQLIVCPGSELVCATAERDGFLQTFREAGALIMTNACGPCIGQWKRVTDDATKRNSIVTSFNRNFAKRADGNPNTHAFIASPEVAVGYAFTGSLSEHPSFSEGWPEFTPQGHALPTEGYCTNEAVEAVKPAFDIQPDSTIDIQISPESERLQRLTPFTPWNGKDFSQLPMIIKVQGQCTTDHISMAGVWLRFRGHLQNISRNLLLGATNAFTGTTGQTLNTLTGETEEIWKAAQDYRDHKGGSIIVAEDNYGEGSSREHAAMEPRYLGVKVVLAKSFARIHETNLKKQGILALTFADPTDYDKIQEQDTFDVNCSTIRPGSTLTLVAHHTDGSSDSIEALHTYNTLQIEWFKAGSALSVKTPSSQA
uniref:aconitate hydratase n=1 Tax=Alloprevotella sp. TaxID=1872471 RepID=UPI004027B709